MSGRSLPEQCSKSGPAFCAWQFPNVSMSAATDAKTHSQRWSVHPGFLDPFHVVYQCVKRLKAATYVNVKYASKLRPVEVNYDVKEHIKNGSSENVTAVIRKYACLEHVLLFLLKYLKERGPLMKFKYNSTSLLNEVTANPRYMVSTFLTTLCEFELDFHAAVVLGDYLNFVLYVAYAHDLFWMKELLSEIWAPLLIDFINVGDRVADNLTDAQKTGKQRLMMQRMIDTLPWEKLKSQENIKITVNPQIHDSYLKRKAAEAASLMQRLTTKPVHQTTLLTGGGGITKLLGSLDTKGPEILGDDPAAIAAREAEELEKKKREEEAVKRKAMEDENRDYSSDYGYSQDFLEKHAPHGMCKPGFDNTL
uniref:Tho2 domain-containing protein n=1 Tax=Macrostomum lignano TaxID=282301 RepID=A0A1I8GA12_9PLAT